MSHQIVFGFAAVAESARAALPSIITISQNRGYASAREPRPYHGRGFSLLVAASSCCDPSAASPKSDRSHLWSATDLTKRSVRCYHCRRGKMHGPCELRIARAVACRRRACAVSLPGRASARSHRMFGAGDQIAKASSDPARNDFGSKRLGDRIQARRTIRDIRVDQKTELGKMGGLGTAKWGTSRKPREKTDTQSLAHPCDRVAVRRIGGAYRRRANLARGQ